MKIDLMGDCGLSGTHTSGYEMFGMDDDELFEYIDNHPNPELMGGKLADAFKRGTKKIRAKVQKVVKKAAAKYKKLPKWAKVVTGIVGAPALVGAIAPIAAPALSIAKTTALTALPAALPVLQAKKMKKKIDAARKKRLAQQSLITNNQVSSPVTSEDVQQVQAVQQTYQQPASVTQYDTSSNYDNDSAVEQTEAVQTTEKKSSLPWLLGAAALIPFLI